MNKFRFLCNDEIQRRYNAIISKKKRRIWHPSWNNDVIVMFILKNIEHDFINFINNA